MEATQKGANVTRRLTLVSLALAALAACAGNGGGLGIGAAGKTNQLAPGMKPSEVKAILGVIRQAFVNQPKIIIGSAKKRIAIHRISVAIHSTISGGIRSLATVFKAVFRPVKEVA